MTISTKIKPTIYPMAGFLLIFTMSLLYLSQNVAAENATVPDPGPKDRCPVCGMLVAKFPSWRAGILYADGIARHFDGTKDMFEYLLALPKYEPQRKMTDIKAIVVTDYYHLRRIDARKALFVIGSDVLGPMGHELIPLTSDEEAQEFLKDHEGSHILSFDEIDMRILNRLEEGKFD